MDQINSGPKIEVPCELCGRYLSITLPGTGREMTLCEVLIYGDQECPTHAGNTFCVMQNFVYNRCSFDKMVGIFTK